MKERIRGIVKFILTTSFGVGVMLTFIGFAGYIYPDVEAVSTGWSYVAIVTSAIFILFNAFAFIKTTIFGGGKDSIISKINNLLIVVTMFVAGIAFMDLFAKLYINIMPAAEQMSLILGLVFGIVSTVGMFLTTVDLSTNFKSGNKKLAGLTSLVHMLMFIAFIAVMISWSIDSVDYIMSFNNDLPPALTDSDYYKTFLTGAWVVLWGGILITITGILMAIASFTEGIIKLTSK